MKNGKTDCCGSLRLSIMLIRHRPDYRGADTEAKAVEITAASLFRHYRYSVEAMLELGGA